MIALSSLRVEFLLSVLGGLVVVVMLGGLFGGEAGSLLSSTLFCAGVILVAFGMHRSYAHEAFGVCNLITMTRLALVSSLAALLAATPPVGSEIMWFAFATALLSLALDGCDGWAARRAHLVSDFGARFDMEVDSVFALLLSVIAYTTGQAGPWVIALGLPRYAFLLAGMIRPELSRPLPEAFSRKAVCVVQIGVLIAFLVPIIPDGLTTFAALVAAIALFWSFSRDIRQLIRAQA